RERKPSADDSGPKASSPVRSTAAASTASTLSSTSACSPRSSAPCWASLRRGRARSSMRIGVGTRSAQDRETAVDDQRVAGHVAGGGTGQEEHGGGHVLGRAH